MGSSRAITDDRERLVCGICIGTVKPCALLSGTTGFNLGCWSASEPDCGTSDGDGTIVAPGDGTTLGPGEGTTVAPGSGASVAVGGGTTVTPGDGTIVVLGGVQLEPPDDPTIVDPQGVGHVVGQLTTSVQQPTAVPTFTVRYTGRYVV